MDALVKSDRSSHQRFERHGARDVRSVPEISSVAQCERRYPCVRLRAVDQCDPFLGTEGDWLEPVFLQYLRRRSRIRSVDMKVSFSNQSNAKRSKWSKVAARANASLLVNGWMNPRVEHREQKVDELRSSARESLGENVRTQQHHCTNFALWQKGANACSVTANEIHLKLCQPVARNGDLGELSESRRHPVHDIVSLDNSGNHLLCVEHSPA